MVGAMAASASSRRILVVDERVRQPPCHRTSSILAIVALRTMNRNNHNLYILTPEL